MITGSWRPSADDEPRLVVGGVEGVEGKMASTCDRATPRVDASPPTSAMVALKSADATPAGADTSADKSTPGSSKGRLRATLAESPSARLGAGAIARPVAPASWSTGRASGALPVARTSTATVSAPAPADSTCARPREDHCTVAWSA